MVFWDGDRRHPGGQMILCGDKTDVSGRGVGEGGGYPTRKDIRRREERDGRSKNSYVTISDGV